MLLDDCKYKENPASEQVENFQCQSIPEVAKNCLTVVNLSAKAIIEPQLLPYGC